MTSLNKLQCLALNAITLMVASADEVNWINGPDSEAPRVELTRSFSIEDSVRRATIRIAAEYCDVVVRMNGRVLVGLDSFGPLHEIDVARFIRRNANQLSLSLRNRPGPSAVAFTLDIQHSDRLLRVVSDDEWQCGQQAAKEHGRVSALYWGPARGSRITGFEDYTQWKMAQPGAANSSDAPEITCPPEFEVDLVRKAGPDDGSWVSMAFDPQGRAIIAREDQGLLQVTLNPDGTAGSLTSVNADLKECRGLLFAHGYLYANANNSKGLYRLSDRQPDGSWKTVDLLREFPGGVGHGRNDLALGPDGLIYSIHGDAVKLPEADIRDRTSPLRDRTAGQGHLIRTDKDGSRFELVAAGLRNPYGIAFHRDGDAFTYDADAEHDMGAPWYRPTRLDMLSSGTDFGWRARTGQWPPYELDRASNALPTATIGKGSPTSVMFGYQTSFPPPWKDSLFVLDWAYGRIVACHLFARGAGYVCRTRSFLKGRPLNVTDLATGPDGHMYFLTGGRKTESSLYRVRWVGRDSESPQTAVSPHRRQSDEWSRSQRRLRRRLEELHAPGDDVIDRIWPFLGNSDPAIRTAAVTALEHQPEKLWIKTALTERHPTRAAVVLLSAFRAGASAEELESSLLHAEGPVASWEKLSVYSRLALLECLEQCLGSLSDRARGRLSEWTADLLNRADESSAPVGAGTTHWKLARLLMLASPRKAHREIIHLLRNADEQDARMFYLFLLRNAEEGWKLENRRLWFRMLNELEQGFLGGDGMPGFLKTIRKEAIATLTEEERSALKDLIDGADNPGGTLKVNRPHVHSWTASDIEKLVLDKAVDLTRGRRLFREALCIRCHRVDGEGGVAGPDLSAAGQRFSRRDLLASVLTPSAVVAEKYRQSIIVTRSGRSLTGRVLAQGDYRSPALRLQTDILDGGSIEEIPKAEIQSHQTVPLSVMPEGLLNSLTAQEIADLIAWLATGNIQE